jgi:xanthine/uracil permease
MDWSLLVFLVVILFFAYRGFRKGLLKSIARILSVVAGYACAILYSKQVSGIIESELQLQGILALIAASLLLFFGASILVGLLFWLLEKLLAGAPSWWSGRLPSSVTPVRSKVPAPAWQKNRAKSKRWPTGRPERRWLRPCPWDRPVPRWRK